MNEQLVQTLAQALQTEGADPLQALLVQQLAQQSEAETGDDDTTRTELEHCRRTVRRLGAEVAAANAMTDWVAQALGACPACWGLNRFCRHCLGAGTPGSSEPDVERLVDWIAPALSRAGLSVIPSPPRDQAGSAITEGAGNGNS